jgi:hypothetical protein
MKELIARLEKATGPDRELDVAIAFAVGLIRERDGNYLYATGNDSDMVVEPNEYDDHLVAQPLRYFTSSIDCALSLVPEGWIWDLASTGAAWVMPDGDIEGQIVVSGIKHPAIALVIAALRAREAMK